MKYKGIYYDDETDKGRTAQAVHKRDQSDAACGIYMFFMACANRVSAKWHRVDGIPDMYPESWTHIYELG